MADMKTVTLFADWDPKAGFKLGPKDVDGKLTYLGSKVWRNPHIEIIDKAVPKPRPGQILVEVKACGICGSDVHAEVDIDAENGDVEVNYSDTDAMVEGEAEGISQEDIVNKIVDKLPETEG